MVTSVWSLTCQADQHWSCWWYVQSCWQYIWTCCPPKCIDCCSQETSMWCWGASFRHSQLCQITSSRVLSVHLWATPWCSRLGWPLPYQHSRKVLKDNAIEHHECVVCWKPHLNQRMRVDYKSHGPLSKDYPAPTTPDYIHLILHRQLVVIHTQVKPLMHVPVSMLLSAYCALINLLCHCGSWLWAKKAGVRRVLNNLLVINPQKLDRKAPLMNSPMRNSGQSFPPRWSRVPQRHLAHVLTRLSSMA